MTAKKKSDTSNVTWNNPKPKAAVGKPKPQSAADKKATEKANKNPQYTGKNVPVKQAGKGFAGSGGTTAQGFAMSKPTKPSNVGKAVAAAAGIGAATGFKLATKYVVSETTKKLQRELSKDMKRASDKDIRSMPKAKREDIAFARNERRVQSEADFYSNKMGQQELRSKISESMKKTTQKKTTLKKRK
jgi:hypothetical protein